MIRKPRTEKKFTPEAGDAMTSAACLNRIYKKVELDGLSDEAAGELAEDIKFVADRFSVSPKAAVLLAAILERHNSNNCVDKEDLANYIGCTNIEFISFNEAITELEDSSIICGMRGPRAAYCVSPEALKAIEKECAFVPMKKTDLTTEDLFTRLRMLVSDLRHDRIDTDRFTSSVDELVEKNQQLLFCREALRSWLYGKCTDTERRMFFYICHRYVSWRDDSVDIDTLMNLTEFMEDDQRIRRHISLEKTGLQACGLAEFSTENGFVDTDRLSLTADVQALWFDEIELPPRETVKHKDLISWESLKDQKLFYNPKEGEQIARLENLLEEENFRKVQQRLESQGMPKGFSCVFHGCPGSGKTASLKALARKTKRDLFWVDLSSIKSKWVGESEKQIKQLFDTYRMLVRTSERCPILAVNEADALFNKRISNPEQSVDQMNNAITDILLNELENLTGILIATTNFVGNMMGERDNAMERRFLYKVEFRTPEESVRTEIWKSKLSDLSDEDASTLAHRFSFAGGSIDNIARKSTVDYVLSGSRPELGTLISWCEEESISKQFADTKHIGF